MSAVVKYLETYFDEVSAFEFYREIFPEGELDKRDSFTPGKYTGIIVEVTNDRKQNGKQKILRHTLTDELDKIEELSRSQNFCLMSPISYAGKHRNSDNARLLYAIAFDLDGIVVKKDGTPQGIIDLFYQIKGPSHMLPLPTFVVSSGTGLHLYYVLDRPIALFKNVVKQLKAYKHTMTSTLWNGYVTTLEDNVQQESIFQGFRVVGTRTKAGGRVRAFQTGGRVTMEYLNSFVKPEQQVTEYAYKSNLTLQQSKEKYPEWYQERIVEKKPKRHWTADRSVYDWWKRNICDKNKVKVGHRYYCMMMLAVYARKCGIDKDELEKDAFEIMIFFESMTNSDDNHFDEADVLDALEAYNDKYITYPINSISYLTDIQIQKNKRNGRKQAVHMKIMSSTRDILYPEGKWREGNGRPKGSGTSKDKILHYLYENPSARKSEIIRETGLSKPTVYKYYDECLRKVNMPLSVSDLIQESLDRDAENWRRQFEKEQKEKRGKSKVEH